MLILPNAQRSRYTYMLSQNIGSRIPAATKEEHQHPCSFSTHQKDASKFDWELIDAITTTLVPGSLLLQKMNITIPAESPFTRKIPEA